MLTKPSQSPKADPTSRCCSPTFKMPGSMDGLKLAHAVRERWPPIKIILVSGQLKPADIDIPADSRFYGKPLEAKEMIAELHSMIGHA